MNSFDFIKEILSSNPYFYEKKMFGGLALYSNHKLVMVLYDSPKTTWKNKNYKQEIWNGIFICTSKEYHEKLILKFPELSPHAVLKKWLFLKSDISNFEEISSNIAHFILKNPETIGIPVVF